MAVFEMNEQDRTKAAEFMNQRYEADKRTELVMRSAKFLGYTGPNFALLDELVSDNLNGAIRLMYGPDAYVAPDEKNNKIVLQSPPYDWVLRRYFWAPVNRWGENIFMSDSTHARGECWQNHNPNLDLWNHDSLAQGDPQDLEHFHFEYVDRNAGTVRIRDYQNYVYWDPTGNLFRIGASPDGASSFYVDFNQSLLFNMAMSSFAAATGRKIEDTKV